MADDLQAFENFRKHMKKNKSHLHILNSNIPVDAQANYLKYAVNVRKNIKKQYSEEEIEYFASRLNDPEEYIEDKRLVLVKLASSKSVKAYSFLKEYTQNPDEALAEWSQLAMLQIQIELESEFLGEQQIYVTTGLGGEGYNLRYNALFISEKGVKMKDFQKELFIKELQFGLPRKDCIFEKVESGINYISLIFLAPVDTDIRSIFEVIIKNCRELGCPISNRFIITNVKAFDEKTIAKQINEEVSGEGKTITS